MPFDYACGVGLDIESKQIQTLSTFSTSLRDDE